MKLKTILFFILIIITTFIIYLTKQDNQIYYVNIDTTNKNTYNKLIYKHYKDKNKLEKYVNNFSIEDTRTTDLIRNIEENQKIKNQTIQNALIKADILTVFVGINDINYKIGNTSKEEIYNYTDQVLIDIEQLFKLIRVYCKEKIYVIGYYNNYGISYNEYFNYTNKRLKSICNEYNIIFINPNNLEKNNLDKSISKEIINKF